ncbi:hypothetical protein S83_000654 [Arachis hypogaea]
MQCNKGVQISSSSTIGNFRYFTENNNLQNDEIRESLATKPYVLADITNTDTARHARMERANKLAKKKQRAIEHIPQGKA